MCVGGGVCACVRVCMQTDLFVKCGCVTGEVWVCYGNMSQCKVYCVTGEVSRQHESV